MADNFRQKIALSLNNAGDYSSIFEGIGNRTPVHRFGRGFVNMGENVYEFQTAKICEPKDYNVFIKNKVKELKTANKTVAENIPILPDKVKLSTIQNKITSLSSIPIGLRKKDLKLENYDFKNNFINIITANDIDEATQFASNIWEEIKLLKNVSTIIIDPERKVLTGRNDLNDNYNKLLSVINQNCNVDEEDDEEGTEENEKDNEEIVCIILGLDRFINYLDEIIRNAEDDEDDEDEDEEEEECTDGIEKFTSIVKKSEKCKRITFIIIDNSSKIKEHCYDEWYEPNIIWVGNEIEEQYLLEVNASRKEISNNCGCSFGYINKKNKTIMIKLLEMKEKREDDDE